MDAGGARVRRAGADQSRRPARRRARRREAAPARFASWCSATRSSRRCRCRSRQTFPRVLETELNRPRSAARRGRELGVSGYGTAGEFLLYRDAAALSARSRPARLLSGQRREEQQPDARADAQAGLRADGTLDRVTAGKVGARRRRRPPRLSRRSPTYFRKLALTRQPALGGAAGRLRTAQARRDCGRFRWWRACPVDYGMYAAVPPAGAGRMPGHIPSTLLDRAAARGHCRRRALRPDDRHRARADLSGRLAASCGDISGDAERSDGIWTARSTVCVRHGARCTMCACVALSPAFREARRDGRAVALASRWPLDGRRPCAGGQTVDNFLRGGVLPVRSKGVFMKLGEGMRNAFRHCRGADVLSVAAEDVVADPHGVRAAGVRRPDGHRAELGARTVHLYAVPARGSVRAARLAPECPTNLCAGSTLRGRVG